MEVQFLPELFSYSFFIRKNLSGFGGVTFEALVAYAGFGVSGLVLVWGESCVLKVAGDKKVPDHRSGTSL